MLEIIGLILITVTALQAAELVFAYHRTTSGTWKNTEMGRHLMVFMVAMALVLLMSATGYVSREVFDYNDPDWFRALRTVVFISIPVVLGWKRYLLAKVQFAAKKEKE